jgi:hypothetical protein
MSYVFFQDVLAAIGKKINFESISNLFGRTVFDKKGGEAINKMIQQANPLIKASTTNSAATFLSMPGAMAVIESGEHQKEQATKALGDMSWFEEYLK